MIEEIHNKKNTNTALKFGLASRVFSALSAPVTFFLIASNLSQSNQGIYYLITSLLAIQVIFELGLGVVLTQFLSHEFAKAKFGRGGVINGEKESVLKILKINVTAIQLYILMAFLFVGIVTPIGLTLLGENIVSEPYIRVILIAGVIGVALNMLIIPLISLESASGNIYIISRIEALVAVTSAILFWILLVLGHGIYGIASTPLVKFFCFAFYFIKKRRPFFRQTFFFWGDLYLFDKTLLAEMWPMQWRVAISWISGYLVFQLFVPIVFHFHGPVEAGKMGITLSMINTVMSLSLVIINTKAPELGYLAAQKRWRDLDKAFYNALKKGLLVALILSMVAIFGIFLFGVLSIYENRFLPIDQTALLMAGILLQIAISHFGVYLRSYKKEPLIRVIITHALLQASLTFLLGSIYGTRGITFSVIAVNIIILPLTIHFWRIFRNEWQNRVKT